MKLRKVLNWLNPLVRTEGVKLEHVAVATIFFVAGAVVGTRFLPAVFKSGSVQTTEAIDCSWSCPSGATISGKNYAGVLRYLSFDRSGKNITQAQMNDYRSHGLAVALNWEYDAQDALGGYNQGVAYATAAKAQAAAVGYPTNAVIYFSVDFDAAESQQCTIDNYFKGIDSVLGVGRVGAYGGIWPLARPHLSTWGYGCPSSIADGHLATYYWQTLAWSGGLQYNGNSLYQNGGTDFWNGSEYTSDINNIRKGWGQWNSDGSVGTLNPPPAPVVSPSPVAAPTACNFGTSGWSLKPWPDGSGNQYILEYKYGGVVNCASPQFSYGLRAWNKYTGQWINIGWDPWTTRTTDPWYLSYYTTPCSSHGWVYSFWVALRSGTGAIKGYYQIKPTFAINTNCS